MPVIEAARCAAAAHLAAVLWPVVACEAVAVAMTSPPWRAEGRARRSWQPVAVCDQGSKVLRVQ